MLPLSLINMLLLVRLAGLAFKMLLVSLAFKVLLLAWRVPRTGLTLELCWPTIQRGSGITSWCFLHATWLRILVVRGPPTGSLALLWLLRTCVLICGPATFWQWRSRLVLLLVALRRLALRSNGVLGLHNVLIRGSAALGL
jgi:hypothetical protein